MTQENVIQKEKKNPNNTNVDEGQFTYLEFSFHYISGIQSEALAPIGVQNTEGAGQKKKSGIYIPGLLFII